MTKIIDNMHTKQAIAAWEAADHILARYDYDEEFAVLQTLLAVGHGIDQTEADLLVSCIRTLAKEG